MMIEPGPGSSDRPQKPETRRGLHPTAAKGAVQEPVQSFAVPLQAQARYEEVGSFGGLGSTLKVLRANIK